jgi:hypothetical protein
MRLPARDVVAKLYPRVPLRENGELLTHLSEQEAQNLCRLEYVQGICSLRKGGDGRKEIGDLRFLELIVTRRRLQTVLRRMVARSGRISAEGSKTTFTNRFGVFHSPSRSRAYRDPLERIFVFRRLVPAA